LCNESSAAAVANGENPNRLYKHSPISSHLKPSPVDVRIFTSRVLAPSESILKGHDIRFEEDNWESPTLGAWASAGKCCSTGLEITQFTYFQQSGGIDLRPHFVELTYGLERFAHSFRGDLARPSRSTCQPIPTPSVGFPIVLFETDVMFLEMDFDGAKTLEVKIWTSTGEVEDD